MSWHGWKAKGDHVLIEPIRDIKESAGGILFPDLKNEYAERRGLSVGRVLAVGTGGISRKGVLMPTELRPGDVVLVPDIDVKQRFQLNGVDFVVQHEGDVLGVVE